MKKILITGSNGFVGGNLCSALALREGIELFRYDLDGTPEELNKALAVVDVIFHLAGVNRPQKIEDFKTGNADFTESLCSTLLAMSRSPLIVLSSSIQAELDNPYGISKRQAEIAVNNYATKCAALLPTHHSPLTTHHFASIYRLPNVFGKGCRPNYNSAVATFCHNLARDLEIKINDPSVEMKLVYIDDVVDEFMRALERSPTRQGDYCVAPIVHQVKLGRIAELLQAFKRSRADLLIPDQAADFTKKLYATYLSYLPTDKFSYPLKMNVDTRGSFTEFIKTPERGQVSINISKPNITKGNHWHRTKNEKFLVVSGRGVIRFRKVNSGTQMRTSNIEQFEVDPLNVERSMLNVRCSCCEAGVIEYFVSGEKLEVVDIPPGYTHNIENLGDTDMVTVMWASEAFDPQKPDTFMEIV